MSKRLLGGWGATPDKDKLKTSKLAECTDISHRSKLAKGWILVFFICVTTRPFLIVAGHLGIEDY